MIVLAAVGGFTVGVLAVLLLSRYLERRDARWIDYE